MPKKLSIIVDSKLIRKIRDDKKKILKKIIISNPNLNIKSSGSLTPFLPTLSQNFNQDIRQEDINEFEECQELEVIASKYEMNVYDPFEEVKNIPTTDVINSSGTTEVLRKFLQKWISECKINQNHAKLLLRFLQKIFPALPIDPRTIMGTMSLVHDHFEMFSGKYLHVGLKKNLDVILMKIIQTPTQINLDFFIDGFPIFKVARKNDMWVILGRVFELSGPFTIGLYFGESKPGDFRMFLRMFVDELKTLMQEYVFNGHKIVVKIRAFVMDSPAKSSALGTKACHGKCGCSRCTIRGNHSNSRMSFHKTSDEIQKRTDQSFRNRSDPEYHLFETPLEDLDFDIVQQVVNEPFHLLYLGICKTLFKLWFGYNGRPGMLNACVLEQINIRIIRLMDFHVEDFQRPLELLDNYLQFKGSQFRCFVLYTGPFLLKDILPDKLYKHFLMLHAACKILSDRRLSVTCTSVAMKIIEDFVVQHSHIYGIEQVGPNVHAFMHLPENVEYFKCQLEEFSAFPFESYLSQLKSLVKNHKSPLEEMYKRLDERMKSSLIESIKIQNNRAIISIPIKSQRMKTFNNLQYYGYQLGSNPRRCHVMTKTGKVLKIQHFVQCEKIITVVGNFYEEISSFFINPIDSALLNIFQCKKHSLSASVHVPLSDLKRKFYAMGGENETNLIVFPLQEFSDEKHLQ